MPFANDFNRSLAASRFDNVKKGNHPMRKRAALKMVSIVLAIVTVLAIACAITVTGSGFLDLSNIARGVFIVTAIICGMLAAAAWKYAKK